MSNVIKHLCYPERDESDEEHMSEEDSDDEDNDIPYNPKNLPLGWDGKVRFWLRCRIHEVCHIA